MRTWLIALLVLAPIFGLPTSSYAQGTDPAAVVKALEAAVNAHDLEATVALFADDAVIRVLPEAVGGTHTGKEEIRQWFDSLNAGNFHIAVDIRGVEGDKVTTLSVFESDSLKQIGVPSLEVTEEYTIREGKILGFNSTYTAPSLARLQAALAPQTMPNTGEPELPFAPWVLLCAATLTLAGVLMNLRRLPAR